MFLPKLVNSSQFIVHRLRKTNHFALFTSHFKLKPGFSLIELLVACHPKPWRRKAIQGFSLIELLVVISIIGLLAALGTASLSNAQQKGRDARRKADLKAIQQALELFFQANGRYPQAGATDGQISCMTGAFAIGIPWGNPFTCGSNTFMQQIPKDPVYVSDLTRQYMYDSSGTTSYTLYASLENTLDPEITAACTLINWNYCVNQP